MPPFASRRDSGVRQVFWTSALAVVAVGACKYPPPTAPIPGGEPPASAPKEVLLRYGSSLEFRLREVVSDHDVVLDPQYPRAAAESLAVLVAVEPQIGVHQLTEEQLRQGRIVARFRKGPRGSLPSYGLAEGDTLSYWVMYYDGRWKGRFISQSMDTKRNAEYDPHKEYDYRKEGLSKPIVYKQAAAKWVLLPQVDTLPRKLGWHREAGSSNDPPGGGATVLFAVSRNVSSQYLIADVTARTVQVTCTSGGCCR